MQMREFKRIAAVMFIFLFMMIVFVSGSFEFFSNPVQLVMLKTLLVSAGLLLAHIVRKALFPKLDYANDNNWQHFLIILSFYIVIPYCFSMGG